MPQKLWSKDIPVNDVIEQFTTGNDRVLDLALAPYDILGSLAHITMLETIGLLTKKEWEILSDALKALYHQAKNQAFTIEEGVEDVHSQVELLLTRKLGDVGKKIHSGRSRNDQVQLDIKLYVRDRIEALVGAISELFHLLQAKSELYKDILLPGYTHFQVAMPSSFGLWFGAYAEALSDDLLMLQGAYQMADKNPLGSAAGYGSSFPLNRTLTTKLLGFSDLHYNVVYAQMTRGKFDIVIANALGNLAYTLNKFATDNVLYVCQNFAFVSFPEEFMEGSSIMPHKKNPDVFELIRARTNQLKSHQASLHLLTTNMPSGYHRDWQVLKEYTIPMFDTLMSCIRMTVTMLEKIIVSDDIVKDPMYRYMFSVDRVNELVLRGVPFRDAYRQVGTEIKESTFVPVMNVSHTHEGSMGNLSNHKIAQIFKNRISDFSFDRKNEAIQALIS